MGHFYPLFRPLKTRINFIQTTPKKPFSGLFSEIYKTAKTTAKLDGARLEGTFLPYKKRAKKRSFSITIFT